MIIRDNWQTPSHILELVRDLLETHQIPLDPCTSSENPTGAWVYLTPQQDGLKHQWLNPWFCNPPFSQKPKWMAHALKSPFQGAMLLPGSVLHNKNTRDLVGQFQMVIPVGRIAYGPTLEMLQAGVKDSQAAKFDSLIMWKHDAYDSDAETMRVKDLAKSHGFPNALTTN